MSGARIEIKSRVTQFFERFAKIIDIRIYSGKFASFDNVISFDVTAFTHNITFLQQSRILRILILDEFDPDK